MPWFPQQLNKDDNSIHLIGLLQMLMKIIHVQNPTPKYTMNISYYLFIMLFSDQSYWEFASTTAREEEGDLESETYPLYPRKHLNFLKYVSVWEKLSNVGTAAFHISYRQGWYLLDPQIWPYLCFSQHPFWLVASLVLNGHTVIRLVAASTVIVTCLLNIFGYYISSLNRRAERCSFYVLYVFRNYNQKLCLFYLRRKLVVKLSSHVAKIFNVPKATRILRIGKCIEIFLINAYFIVQSPDISFPLF